QALRFPPGYRGASSALKRLWGLPSPVLPQDFEFTSSNMPTHEGNAIAFSRSLRAFHSNQQGKKSTIFFYTAF
ncbi:MAG: hypothetical protein Q8929_07535, partial [Bacillota bacterium]|nr:hypothetical protein [Bacillota bacterium]